MFCTKKKLFGSFAPTPSPRHHHGPPGGLQLPPDHQLQSFLALSKTNAPIFFLHYPLSESPIITTNTNYLKYWFAMLCIASYMEGSIYIWLAQFLPFKSLIVKTLFLFFVDLSSKIWAPVFACPKAVTDLKNALY